MENFILFFVFRDRLTTMLNVWGDCVICGVVNHFSNDLENNESVRNEQKLNFVDKEHHQIQINKTFEEIIM